MHTNIMYIHRTFIIIIMIVIIIVIILMSGSEVKNLDTIVYYILPSILVGYRCACANKGRPNRFCFEQ